MARSDEGDGERPRGKQAGLPLAGVKVVDLTRVMVGPYCTMMLGDLGADVVKIEIPGRGDDTRHWGPPFVDTESVYYLSVNRNKRSIALDLKQDAAKEALWRLIEGADVLVENFSPGTLDRLGFGYEAVKARRPEIVYAAISGFGQSGPDYQRTAYDLIVQGTSGMMSITGHPGGPPTRLGVPIADIGGGMFAAYAIVAALFDRERSGEGSYVDVSMLGGQVALLTYQAGLYLSTGATPGQLGNAHPMIAPYDTFATADGYVNIAVGNNSLWERFCTALDLESLLDEECFATNAGRSTNREALYATSGAEVESAHHRRGGAPPRRGGCSLRSDPRCGAGDGRRPDACPGSHPRGRASADRPVAGVRRSVPLRRRAGARPPRAAAPRPADDRDPRRGGVQPGGDRGAHCLGRRAGR